MFNKNNEPKIKLSRLYIDHLINKNKDNKKTYTIAKTSSYLDRWKIREEKEDQAYKRRR